MTQGVLDNRTAENGSASDILPYLGYDAGLFHLKVGLGDEFGALGIGWEVKPRPVEGLADAELQDLSSGIEGILQGVPDGTAIQVITVATADAEGVFAAERMMTETGRRIVGEPLSARYEMLRGKAPRKVRTYLTARVDYRWSGESWFKSMMSAVVGGSDGAAYARDEAAAIAKLERTRSVVEEMAKGTKTELISMDAEMLYVLLNRIMNPKWVRRNPLPPFDAGVPLADQVFTYSPILKPGGFVLDGHESRILSLRHKPAETTPGMLVSEFAFGGNQVCVLDVVPSMAIVVNVFISNQEKEQGRIKIKRTLSFFQKKNMIGDDSIESGVIKEDLNEALRKNFQDGTSFTRVGVHFIISEPPQVVGKSAEQVQSAVSRLGMRLGVEDNIGACVQASCLPFAYTGLSEPFLQSGRVMMSDEAADIMPLYGRFMGTKTPLFTYLTRRNEIFAYDSFESPTNPHTCLFGGSGAGKSVLLGDKIKQALRCGIRSFVIDQGDSFKRLCTYVGGQYISFTGGNRICINPFGEVGAAVKAKGDDRTADADGDEAGAQAFAEHLLCTMASGGGKENIGLVEESMLSDAFRRAALEEGENLRLSHIAKVLQTDARLAEGGIGPLLARKLAPWYDRGRYASFFDGPNTLRFSDAPMVVCELGKLDERRDLLRVVLMIMMYLIREDVTNPKKRGQKTQLVVDEAWSLFDDDHSATFLKGAAKTYRKFGCATTFCSQQIEDFDTKAGQAVLDNTETKEFMRQEMEVYDRIVKKFKLSDGHAEKIRTLTTEKGVFSEVAYKGALGFQIFRFYADPWGYWLHTTHPADLGYLRNLMERGLSERDAIRHAMAEKPGGIH